MAFNSNYKYIVTHPGRAHTDDVLGVAIALHLNPVPVYRREPSEEELQDQEVLVLDIGGSYEPTLGNYDHHQFPRDHAPECAVTLLLMEILGPNRFSEIAKAFKWVENVAVLDSKGPVVFAEKMDISVDALFGLQSPIATAVMKIFEEEESLETDSALSVVLASIGKGLLGAFNEYSQQMTEARALVEVVTVDGVSGIYVPGTFNAMVTRALKDEAEDDIAFLISFDDRGSGLVLYRYDDDPRLDFSYLCEHDDVLFAHNGGFIAKTKSKGLDNALGLVQLSLTVSPSQ